jgi:hypothetical protein
VPARAEREIEIPEAVTPEGGPPFELLQGANNDIETMQRYWADYDHVFPRFFIKSKV